jgi:hypothetical protein
MPNRPAMHRGKQMQSPKYRNRKQASLYLKEKWCLKRSPNYLAKLAVVGGGPAFRKANRDPLYTDEDLDAYAENQIGPRVNSTSELRAL